MKCLAATGALALAVAVFAVVFFFGGFYSFAALRQQADVLGFAFGLVREASVVRQAQAPAVPVSLDDPALVWLGGKLYAQDGCATCHGAPGVAPSPFAAGLRPPAPDLKESAARKDAERLFWIVGNGIRTTSMPAFAPLHPSADELWALVAFVRNMRWVSAEQFAAWSRGEGKPVATTAAAFPSGAYNSLIAPRPSQSRSGKPR